MFRKWAYIPALLAWCFMPADARDIFVTPGESGSSTIGVYRADPFTSAGTITGPAGAFQVLRASATKFYVISRAAVDAVTTYEGTLPSVTQARRFNLPQAPTAAAVSPDGRRVVVVAGSVYVYDTTSDTNLTPTGVSVGSSPTSVAISQDSSRAFVLSPGTQRLSAIDTNSGTVTSTTTIPGGGSQIGAAPNGFIYVTAPNSLLEFDSRTLNNTNTISLNAFPSSIAFTPDGRGAVLINTNPITGSSLIYVDLVRRTFVVAPPLGGGAVLNDVAATDNNTAYASSTQTGRLYSTRVQQGSDAPLTLTQVGFGSVQVEGISDIEPSTEVPARYLFVVSPIGLFRLDSTGAVVGPAQLPVIGALSVNSAPTTTGATTVTALNEAQSVPVGQTSRPLVVRVTDGQGNPVSGVPVTFAPGVAGATIVNAMPATNNLGIALAYLNPPDATTSTTVTVTATATGVASPVSFTVSFGTGGGGPGTPSGGLQIVAGNGQALGQFQTTATQEPLTVRVRDATGRPLPGVNVTWTGKQGNISVPTNISTTDENGIAMTNVVASIVNPGAPFETNIVTASTGAESVDFYLTTLPNLGTTTGAMNTYARQSNSIIIEGRAGQTIPGAIRYDVVSPLGTRLPFIGIRVKSTDALDANGNPVASCRGGTQLSDNEGVASCDLVLGPYIGGQDTQITIIIGSVREERYTIRILPGAPSTVRISQGSGQSGNPGQQLSSALVAEVVDSSGLLLQGVDVQWEVIPPGSVTLSNVVNRTDVNGRVSATATLGQTPGQSQVRVRAADATTTFTLTINVPAASIVKQSGDNQSAAIGTAFSQPLSVQLLNAQGQPVSGGQVTFAVAAGSTGAVTLGTPTATSNAQGVASTTVTAGTTTGPVTVTATIGNLSASFSLTVRPPGPGATAASFFNAAGYQPGISPGSLAVINASGIAPGLNGSVTPGTVGPLPTSLRGVEVQFNGIAAPIFAVSNVNNQESVIVQVPFEVAPGSASVTINVVNGGSTTVTGAPILPVKPGVFETVGTTGQRYLSAVRSDGSYVSATNPARRGEIITVFATGLGQVTPATGTNRVSLPGQNVAVPVIVGVNEKGSRVLSAQLQPGTIGVYLVTFEVPNEAEPGPARNFVIAVDVGGSLVFSNGTFIPIQ